MMMRMMIMIMMMLMMMMIMVMMVLIIMIMTIMIIMMFTNMTLHVKYFARPEEYISANFSPFPCLIYFYVFYKIKDMLKANAEIYSGE